MRGSRTSRVVGILCGFLLLAAVMVAAARSSSSPLDTAGWSEHPRSAAARPPGAGDRVMFHDDFQGERAGANPPSGWEVIDGGWRGVADDGGPVVSHGTGTLYGHMVAGAPEWSDYEVGADVKVTALATGFAGVMGRYQTDTDYYECVVHHATAVQLWRLHDGRGVELGGTQLQIDIARFHRVELVLKGSRLTCMLDGVTMAAVDDHALMTGRIGLVASTGEAAEFANVQVTSRGG
jgi:Domain of Unknown Function (DUF1080)